MQKLLNLGQNIFAVGMCGLGALCFIDKDFIIGRPPAWSANFNVNPALAYISGAAVIICALAIILKKKELQATIGII